MDWIEMKVEVTANYCLAVEEWLLQQGAVSITFTDSEDYPIYEPQEVQLWQNTTISALFPNATPIDQIKESLCQTFSDTPLVITDRSIAAHGWEQKTLESFKPILFGDMLWVCPSWCTSPEPEAMNLILDPGCGFGTGEHPTTALCLEWLIKRRAHFCNQTVVDYGCGSGILGIAAALLKAQSVIGIDIDPQALVATQKNALKNGVFITTKLPSDQHHFTAQVVIANILASPLKTLSTHLSSLVQLNGYLILSGILDTQVEDVLSCYTGQFEVQEVHLRERWACIEAKRKYPLQK